MNIKQRPQNQKRKKYRYLPIITAYSRFARLPIRTSPPAGRPAGSSPTTARGPFSTRLERTSPAPPRPRALDARHRVCRPRSRQSVSLRSRVSPSWSARATRNKQRTTVRCSACACVRTTVCSECVHRDLYRRRSVRNIITCDYTL